MSPRNRTRKPGTGNKPAPVATRPTTQRTMAMPNVPFQGTERLTSITGSGESFIKTFYLNPGLKDTFSVGHFQAQNYDKYLLTGRNAVRYTPSCSTLTTGSVYVLIDYDPTDRAPSTEEEFADNELTLTCPAWGKMSAPIQASRMDNCRKLIRTGPFVESKLLTDACAIHIGAFGFGDTVGIGHIHIDYSAKLFVRQPASILPPLPGNTLSVPLQTQSFPGGQSNALFSLPTYNTVGTVGEPGLEDIQLQRGAYVVDFKLNLRIPGQAFEVFLVADLRKNGVPIASSPIEYKGVSNTDAFLTLSSPGNIIQFNDGDLLTVRVSHDHATSVNISDGSNLTARLV